MLGIIIRRRRRRSQSRTLPKSCNNTCPHYIHVHGYKAAHSFINYMARVCALEIVVTGREARRQMSDDAGSMHHAWHAHRLHTYLGIIGIPYNMSWLCALSQLTRIVGVYSAGRAGGATGGAVALHCLSSRRAAELVSGAFHCAAACCSSRCWLRLCAASGRPAVACGRFTPSRCYASSRGHCRHCRPC